MKQSFTRGTSSFFYFYLFPTIILNLFFPFNHLVVEGLVIGDRGLVGIHQLDLWIAAQYMGGYNRDAYVSLLLAAYFLALLVGVALGALAVGSVFQRVLRTSDLSVGTASFLVRLTGDMLFGGLVVVLVFDPVLAFLLRYPGSVDAFAAGSLLSTYVLTGLITGNALFKLSFPVRVFLKSRRERLTLKLELEREPGKTSGTMHWVFLKKHPQEPSRV